jgi:hypothetical protein
MGLFTTTTGATRFGLPVEAHQKWHNTAPAHSEQILRSVASGEISAEAELLSEVLVGSP